MKIWIRASLLDEDCERRLAAKQWRKLIQDQHGYQLRKTGNHIGAAVGRAAHRVFESQLKYKREVGLIPNRELGISEALQKMDEEVLEEGQIIPDDTTPDRRSAADQVELMARQFNAAYLPYVQPKLIEKEFSYYVDDDNRIMVSTTLDLLTDGGSLIDFKSGKREPKAPKQVGLQAIISEAHGEEINDAGLLWLPRGGGEMKLIPYDLEAIKDEAEEKVERLIKSFDEYIDRVDSRDARKRAKAPLAFESNEKSQTCKAAFCGAFGTPFCPLKQGEPTDDV